MVNIVLPGLYAISPVEAGGDAVTPPSSMFGSLAGAVATGFKGPYGAVNTASSGMKGSVALSVAVAPVCDDPTVCNGMSVTVVDSVADGMSENIDEVDEE